MLSLVLNNILYKFFLIVNCNENKQNIVLSKNIISRSFDVRLIQKNIKFKWLSSDILCKNFKPQSQNIKSKYILKSS